MEQTGEITRELMEGLRPTVLDHYGLLEGLRRWANQFSQRTGITIEVQGEEANPRLAASVELALFRIAQEALNNVAKHAQASQVVLSESVNRNTVRLDIADNGVGFDLKQVRQPEGRHRWGLMTMSERAMAVGGQCRIDSHSGAGTRVVVEVSRNALLKLDAATAMNSGCNHFPGLGERAENFPIKRETGLVWMRGLPHQSQPFSISICNIINYFRTMVVRNNESFPNVGIFT